MENVQCCCILVHFEISYKFMCLIVFPVCVFISIYISYNVKHLCSYFVYFVIWFVISVFVCRNSSYILQMSTLFMTFVAINLPFTMMWLAILLTNIYLFFSFCNLFISLSIMSLGFIHVVVCVIALNLLPNFSYFE